MKTAFIVSVFTVCFMVATAEPDNLFEIPGQEDQTKAQEKQSVGDIEGLKQQIASLTKIIENNANPQKNQAKSKPQEEKLQTAIDQNFKQIDAARDKLLDITKDAVSTINFTSNLEKLQTQTINLNKNLTMIDKAFPDIKVMSDCMNYIDKVEKSFSQVFDVLYKIRASIITLGNIIKSEKGILDIVKKKPHAKIFEKTDISNIIEQQITNTLDTASDQERKTFMTIDNIIKQAGATYQERPLIPSYFVFLCFDSIQQTLKDVETSFIETQKDFSRNLKMISEYLDKILKDMTDILQSKDTSPNSRKYIEVFIEILASSSKDLKSSIKIANEQIDNMGRLGNQVYKNLTSMTESPKDQKIFDGVNEKLIK